MSKRFVISTARSKSSGSLEGVDVAARYFVYKLYDAAAGKAALWHPVNGFQEAAAAVSRAVERGWVLVRDEGMGRAKRMTAMLTEDGRLMARKALR